LLQRLGGAQAGIRFGGVDQQQVAVSADQLQVGFELSRQLRWALVAEGAALHHHHPGPRPERWCAGFLERLGCLGRVAAIEPAEVDRGPGRVDLLVDQRLHRPVARCLVVTPEQMDGH